MLNEKRLIVRVQFQIKNQVQTKECGPQKEFWSANEKRICARKKRFAQGGKTNPRGSRGGPHESKDKSALANFPLLLKLAELAEEDRKARNFKSPRSPCKMNDFRTTSKACEAAKIANHAKQMTSVQFFRLVKLQSMRNPCDS